MDHVVVAPPPSRFPADSCLAFATRQRQRQPQVLDRVTPGVKRVAHHQLVVANCAPQPHSLLCQAAAPVPFLFPIRRRPVLVFATRQRQRPPQAQDRVTLGASRELSHQLAAANCAPPTMACFWSLRAVPMIAGVPFMVFQSIILRRRPPHMSPGIRILVVHVTGDGAPCWTNSRIFCESPRLHCIDTLLCVLGVLSLSLTPRVRAISIATHAALRTSRPLLVTVQQWRAQTTLALTLRFAAPQRIWRGC